MHRGKNPMMVVLLKVRLRFKTTLHSIRGCLSNFVLSYLRLVIIGCLTLRLKRERVLVQQPRSILVPSVERVILVMSSWYGNLLLLWQEWTQG